MTFSTVDNTISLPAPPLKTLLSILEKSTLIPFSLNFFYKPSKNFLLEFTSYFTVNLPILLC